MGTPYAKIPYETLKSIGGKLTGVHDTLKQKDKGAKDVDGLSGDQSDISSRIGDFRDEWGESVKKLQENIGNFGTLSTGIGDMVAGFDRDVAKSLKPDDGGGKSGPGGEGGKSGGGKSGPGGEGGKAGGGKAGGGKAGCGGKEGSGEPVAGAAAIAAAVMLAQGGGGGKAGPGGKSGGGKAGGGKAGFSLAEQSGTGAAFLAATSLGDGGGKAGGGKRSGQLQRATFGKVAATGFAAQSGLAASGFIREVEPGRQFQAVKHHSGVKLHQVGGVEPNKPYLGVGGPDGGRPAATNLQQPPATQFQIGRPNAPLPGGPDCGRPQGLTLPTPTPPQFAAEPVRGHFQQTGPNAGPQHFIGVAQQPGSNFQQQPVSTFQQNAFITQVNWRRGQ